MSFDDLAKYGGLYGGEGVLANIEVSRCVYELNKLILCKCMMARP